jgi:hypothetical protein
MSATSSNISVRLFWDFKSQAIEVIKRLVMPRHCKSPQASKMRSPMAVCAALPRIVEAVDDA